MPNRESPVGHGEHLEPIRSLMQVRQGGTGCAELWEPLCATTILQPILPQHQPLCCQKRENTHRQSAYFCGVSS